MKAYVYVSLKKSVLDPQGKTIENALKKMGYQGVGDVRQGKYFEITLENAVGRSQAEAEVERIAREVLTNPVIEAMMQRRSVRKYTDQKPSEEVIETVVRAGQQAPFAAGHPPQAVPAPCQEPPDP